MFSFSFLFLFGEVCDFCFSWVVGNVVGAGLLAVSGLFVVCLLCFLVIAFMYIHKFLFAFFDWGLLFVFVVCFTHFDILIFTV